MAPVRQRLPLLGIAVAAIVGIEVADRWHLPIVPLLIASAASIVACWFRPRIGLCLAAVAFAFAALHVVRHQEAPGREFDSILQAGPRVATVLGVVDSEPEPLPYKTRHKSGKFRLRIEQCEVAGQSHDIESHLLVSWAGPLPRYGDRVRIHGSLQPLEPPRNPGQFDYADYLRRQGVFARLDAEIDKDCVIEAHDAGLWVIAWSNQSREWMQRQLALDLEDSPEISALVSSMVLGLRGDTNEEVKDLFRRTGTMHLFAVSGLNVAMLGAIAWHLLKPLGVRRSIAVFLIIGLMGFYALVTGLTASCVRAAVMASIVLLGECLDRRPLVFNSLAVAMLFILLYDTNEYFSAGFRFSFVLVAVLVLFAQRIQGFIEPVGRPDAYLPSVLWNRRQRWTWSAWQIVAGACGVTIAAWIGSIPFTAGYFHLFSFSAIGANLISVPLAFCVLTLGLLTLLTAPLAKGLALVFSNANWACAKGLLFTVDLFARMPGGHLYVGSPSITTHPTAEITILDVADGAAIHWRGRNVDWLIDGGSAHYYERVTLPYLRSRGINRLDALFLTHGDAQHIGGAQAMLDDFAPRVIFDSPLKDRSSTRRKLHTELAARRQGKAFIQRGDEIPAGEAVARVLYPPAGMARSTADDKALVLLFECDGVRALFMSDSGFATEMWLLDHESDLRADLLIKGHPEKDLSGTANFIARVNPQAVIVTAPRYGVPAESLARWQQEVEAVGVTVFRQERCGAVSITIRDGVADVSGFLNGQRFRSRAR